ncbi:MAG: hypothetical protein GF399_10425 [Candidatus Coatesbacteria bacterium]|nr:hypothetical protein [Candidatus Coatesbacteria bacterium]
MLDEMLVALAEVLREADVAGDNVYVGQPDPDVVTADSTGVFLQLLNGPRLHQGSARDIILGDTTNVDGTIDTTYSQALYEATVAVDVFAPPPGDGGTELLYGLLDDVVGALDGAFVGDTTSAEAVGGIAVVLEDGEELEGEPLDCCKYRLLLNTVFHYLRYETIWPAETIDIESTDEEGWD